jgi:WhiB family redox-sensing transcriptional regulator
MWLDGCDDVILPTLKLVPVTRTSSMPPASPSTGRRWIRADLLPDDSWSPTPEEQHDFQWDYFPAWHAEAKCRTVDKPDDMFFGENDDHTKTSLTITKIREVKSFCRGCPVFTECLTHALTAPERHGIWAGTSKRTRMRVLALVESGETTIPEVVADYLAGREKKYESIRKS